MANARFKIKHYLVGCYNPSIILTYIAIFISVYTMFLVDKGNYKIIFGNLILVGLCDLFDGKIARACKRNKAEQYFGVQLDTLADVVCSLIFPSYILYTLTDSIINPIIVYMVIVFYISTGIMRLCWFYVLSDMGEEANELENKQIILSTISKQTEQSKRYFIGLPVTATTAIMPILIYILSILNVNKQIRAIASCITYSIISILYILNIKINKPGKKGGITLLVVGLILYTLYQLHIK